MDFRRPYKFAAIAIAVLALAQFANAQTAGDGKIANMSVGAGSVRWDMLVPNAGGAVTISFPDGRSVKRTFRAGSAVEFDLNDKQLESLPDGVYNYDLRLAPALTASQKEALMKARGDDDESETQRNLRKRPAMPALTQNGSFALVNGSLVGPGAIEGERTGSNSAKPLTPAPSSRPMVVSGNTVTRLRNHRFSLGAMPDFVIADDLIVQGSACVGLDCVDGENFGFDTIRVKENNTRIQFDDTSTSAGFPNNNWQIRANASGSGGGNFLAFVDQGATGNSETGTIVFEVDAGAPANSLRVASNGKVGIRTASPVLDLHMNTTDTPAMRMEQNNSGGFTAQTWDVAGNEANFFVRDVTSGSRLPFRIRPGAPTSSIDIAASGNVGIGTASPAGRLAVTYAYPTTGASWTSDSTANHSAFIFSNPNGTVGSINTSGSATAYNTSSDMRLKENITPTKRGLSTLLQISVTDFNFIKDSSQRVQGFLGQDLYKYYPEAVSVGGSDPAKAPWQVDYARVTPLLIQSVKDLNAIVLAQGDQIKSLEAQLKRMKSKQMTRKRKS